MRYYFDLLDEFKFCLRTHLEENIVDAQMGRVFITDDRIPGSTGIRGKILMQYDPMMTLPEEYNFIRIFTKHDLDQPSDVLAMMVRYHTREVVSQLMRSV